jgi:glycosyltransferase involved in cell wall biosynthesis
MREKALTVNPKISVITPSFNCAKYIRECIDSVMNQGSVSFEHIVIDGGSTDETVEILKSYPHIKWISEKDNGEADALNKALKLARGEIIYWLNADDLAEPHIFQLIQEEIDNGADVVYGKALIIDQDGEPVGLRIPKAPISVNVLIRWFQHLHISQPSMFLKREIFDKLGGFKTDLYFSIDLELWLRVAAAGYSWVAVDYVLSRARLVRSDAKSAASRESQEKNWLEVSRPFILNLPELEQVNYWKDLYGFFFSRNQTLPFEPTSNIHEVVGLGFALLELGQIQHLASLLDQALKIHPEHPDLLNLASEIAQTTAAPGKRKAVVSKALETELAARLSTPVVAARPTRKALVLFPHMPYPSSSGAHTRVLSYAYGLRALGYTVTWVGLELFSERLWNDHSRALFEQEVGVKTRLVPHSAEDKRYVEAINAALPSGAIGWNKYLPPQLCSSFFEICQEEQPELVVGNYAYWSDLLRDERAGSFKRILETHDCVTLGSARHAKLGEALHEIHAGNSSTLEKVLDQQFFADLELHGFSQELERCEGMDTVVTISPSEFDLFSHGLKTSPVTYIPGGLQPSNIRNPSYQGHPVFVVGPNNFNAQGILYLGVKVMPELRRRITDAQVLVVGSFNLTLPPMAGINRSGYVLDIGMVYEHAPFSVCPLIGGTGMQMKIVESMAHAVPVVALSNTSLGSPITHGVNGFIANNAEEFTSYCELLLKDRRLCKKLGRAALETIQQRYSHTAFTVRLSDTIAVASANYGRRTGYPYAYPYAYASPSPSPCTGATAPRHQA